MFTYWLGRQRGKRKKNKKERAYVFFSNICTQHKIHYGKHSYFNRLKAETWVKFIVSMRLKGTYIFLPTLKRLENVLKSYIYCVCFVCVGKCFCVAPVILDVLYSWSCTWILCLQCWSKGVCKVLFKSSLRVGWLMFHGFEVFIENMFSKIIFISTRNFNLVSWVLGFFPLSTTKNRDFQWYLSGKPRIPISWSDSM